VESRPCFNISNRGQACSSAASPLWTRDPLLSNCYLGRSRIIRRTRQSPAEFANNEVPLNQGLLLRFAVKHSWTTSMILRKPTLPSCVHLSVADASEVMHRSCLPLKTLVRISRLATCSSHLQTALRLGKFYYRDVAEYPAQLRCQYHLVKFERQKSDSPPAYTANRCTSRPSGIRR